MFTVQMIDYKWDNEEGLQLFMWQKYKKENIKCNGSPAKALYNAEGWSDLNEREHVSMHLNMFKLVQAEHVWTFLNMSKHIWMSLDELNVWICILMMEFLKRSTDLPTGQVLEMLPHLKMVLLQTYTIFFLFFFETFP